MPAASVHTAAVSVDEGTCVSNLALLALFCRIWVMTSEEILLLREPVKKSVENSTRGVTFLLRVP